MRPLDRLLQRWRIRKALPWVRAGDRLLDIGCYDRSLIDRVGDRVVSAVGVDVDVAPADDGKVRLLKGRFPDDFSFDPGSFDCVTCLAVLEHVEDPDAFANACHRVLSSGGRAVLTVPHPFVDRILAVLVFLRLIRGMHVEEHHGFEVAETVPIFQCAGFRLLKRRRFQLGLNHLFVFEKP
ncbi:MAG: class I SAM-dependent methyltransferase [Acidimicrobiia bacterium]